MVEYHLAEPRVVSKALNIPEQRTTLGPDWVGSEHVERSGFPIGPAPGAAELNSSGYGHDPPGACIEPQVAQSSGGFERMAPSCPGAEWVSWVSDSVEEPNGKVRSLSARSERARSVREKGHFLGGRSIDGRADRTSTECLVFVRFRALLGLFDGAVSVVDRASASRSSRPVSYSPRHSSAGLEPIEGGGTQCTARGRTRARVRRSKRKRSNDVRGRDGARHIQLISGDVP
jgi:hypothetical protein